MSTIEYSCGHQVSAHSGQAMPMQCACGMGEIVGERGQFYMSDEMSKKFREAAMNASPLQAIEESGPMNDNCPAARIGELGNQVHNLGCDYQNDEDLSDELGQVAVTLWDLAKKAETRTDAQPEWDGTGRPPVGAECEVLDRVNGKCNRVQITGVSRDHLVALFNGEEVLLKKNCQFLPIRTQSQREREDLLTSIIEDYRTSFNSPVSTIELNLISEFANYLFEIGMLRRAGE